MAIFQTDYQKKLDDALSTGKKRSYFIAAITVFFILLMSFAGIIPAVSSLGLQHEENQKRDVIIGKLENKLKILKNFVREQDDKKSVINFLSDVFPEKFPEKEVLNKIVALEQKNNISLRAYIFGEPQSGVQEVVSSVSSINTKVYALNFSGDGSLSNIQSFIKDIEDSRRIFDVVEVVISRKLGSDLNTGDPLKDFNVSVALNYFYYDREVKALQ